MDNPLIIKQKIRKVTENINHKYFSATIVHGVIKYVINLNFYEAINIHRKQNKTKIKGGNHIHLHTHTHTYLYKSRHVFGLPIA